MNINPFLARSQRKGPNGSSKSKHTSDKVTHMIRRITTKTRGMREADTLRLVQAFIISKITYAIRYAHLSKAETEKVDVIIRKAYKQAPGLPVSTATDKLLKLGLHNTADELIEAHLSSKRLRLGATEAGRILLYRLGLTTPLQRQPSQIKAVAKYLS